MVLPCPGSSPCRAPSQAAINAADTRTQKLNWPWVEINCVKRLRGVFIWAGAGGVGPAGGTTSAVVLGSTLAVVRLAIGRSAACGTLTCPKTCTRGAALAVVRFGLDTATPSVP